MRQRVLIIPDKFKGSLTAREAAEAIARGWRKARPLDQLTLLPMSDGGDGFGEVMGTSLGGRVQTTRTVDSAHRPCVAKWWWEAKSRMAVVESARVIGLAILPRGRFHPFQLDTFGLGAVLAAAIKKGAQTFLIGIGGSATNDAGFGLARALGWSFFDQQGHVLTSWTELTELSSARAPSKIWSGNLRVAVDVQNRLLGLKGATRVYGPQKGIRASDFERAECCLRRLAIVMKREYGQDFAAQPGSGAAGGLGFGLLAFLGAKLEPGFELFSRHAELERHLRKVDLVITGEGSLDASTLMGKGVGQLAKRCDELKIPCIGMAGIVPAIRRKRAPFRQIRALTDLTSVEQAMAKPAYWLAQLAREVGFEALIKS
jgi:glycerate kinase